MDSYLLDTNLLLRAFQLSAPNRLQVLKVIRELISAGEQVYITTQNLVEFWAVATRPVAANGFGWETNQTTTQVQQIRSRFILLEDRPEIFAHWWQLVTDYSVTGRRVHDARLVAVMLTYGITHLLTFNIQDFKSFSGIVLVHPEDVT